MTYTRRMNKRITHKEAKSPTDTLCTPDWLHVAQEEVLQSNNWIRE